MNVSELIIGDLLVILGNHRKEFRLFVGFADDGYPMALYFSSEYKPFISALSHDPVGKRLSTVYKLISRQV